MNCLKTSVLAATAAIFMMTAAVAQAKPSVAVLGLEVVDDGGSINAKTAKFATDLTDALRNRAKSGSSPFKLAPNSDKDLLEMKLLSSCDNEARGCMADIGKELKAERLIYGKVEQRKDGYQVSLMLLNVSSRKMERSTTEVIPAKETGKSSIEKWSQRLYNRLTGMPDEGVLVVKSNASVGTVYVNGEVKGTLSDGGAQISGLPEGRHEVRIEAEGFAPYAGEVTIKGGETHELAAELAGGEVVKPDEGKSETKPGGFNRTLFWGSAGIAVASGAAASLFGLQMMSLEDDKLAKIRELQAAGVVLDPGDACADAALKQQQDVVDICDQGASKATMGNVMLGVTAVSAVAAGYFYYKGFMQADSARSAETASKGTSSAVVQIAPAVAPGYVGAGLQIDF